MQYTVLMFSLWSALMHTPVVCPIQEKSHKLHILVSKKKRKHPKIKLQLRQDHPYQSPVAIKQMQSFGMIDSLSFFEEVPNPQ
jgi:hypothetical protein